MTEEVTNYTREECLPKNISPLGKKYTVLKREGEADMYEVVQVRYDEHGKELPDRRPNPIVEGAYTSVPRAQAALTRVLSIMWDVSDGEREKLDKRKGNRA